MRFFVVRVSVGCSTLIGAKFLKLQVERVVYQSLENVYEILESTVGIRIGTLQNQSLFHALFTNSVCRTYDT